MKYAGHRSFILPAILSLLLMFNLVSCGDDSSDPDTKAEDAFEAVGSLYKATSTTIKIGFEDGEAGAKYFIMPFALGTTSGDAAVQGGESTSVATFDITATGGSSFKIQGATNLAPSPTQVMSGKEFDHALRTLINRYRPGDNSLQKAIADLEDIQVTDGPYASRLALAGQRPSFANIFSSIDQQVKRRHHNHNLRPIAEGYKLLGTCTAQSELVTIGATGDIMNETTVPLKAESADYCLYVHATKGMITETNLETLKASIESSLKAYKDVIYKDKMATTKDGYKFQPHFFILPYGDSSLWQDNANNSYKVTGAFSASLSEENLRPSLYIAADQGAVSTVTDTAKLYETFHATIAHELQHAILHYYRYTQGIKLDSPQFDEGLAHIMEDVLGYGELSFPDFASSFLSTYSSGIDPILANITSGAGTAAQRGGAQVMFYYLISQKGGVSFDGSVSGGDGLAFVRKFVSGTTRNIEGLVAAYGEDWTTTMANLFSTLAIDNASTVVESSKFKVQKPEADIKDTKGGEGKTYGFRFNNYGGLSDLPAKLENFTTVNQTSTLELENYQTTPMLFTLGSTSDTITLTLGVLYDNAGVAVVRFK